MMSAVVYGMGGVSEVSVQQARNLTLQAERTGGSVRVELRSFKTHWSREWASCPTVVVVSGGVRFVYRKKHIGHIEPDLFDC